MEISSYVQWFFLFLDGEIKSSLGRRHLVVQCMSPTCMFVPCVYVARELEYIRMKKKTDVGEMGHILIMMMPFYWL